MKLTKKELNEIIASHGKWLRSEEGGKRADLRGADLSNADLRGADMKCADLSNACHFCQYPMYQHSVLHILHRINDR